MVILNWKQELCDKKKKKKKLIKITRKNEEIGNNRLMGSIFVNRDFALKIAHAKMAGEAEICARIIGSKQSRSIKDHLSQLG